MQKGLKIDEIITDDIDGEAIYFDLFFEDYTAVLLINIYHEGAVEICDEDRVPLCYYPEIDMAVPNLESRAEQLEAWLMNQDWTEYMNYAVSIL